MGKKRKGKNDRQAAVLQLPGFELHYKLELKISNTTILCSVI